MNDATTTALRQIGKHRWIVSRMLEAGSRG
jgi:hypothetical protein